jgi:hypothetical protein
MDRLGSLFSGSRAKDAERKELEGDLEGATALYVEAGRPDDAARLLLLRADAEAAPERRIALCALAAKTATDAALRRQAATRKALLGLDVLRGRSGPVLTTDVLAVAKELEEVGEAERAAEAYAFAGDVEGEVRALAAAGAIEKLEARLAKDAEADRARGERALALAKIDDLDRSGERREALRLARAMAGGPEAERAADVARAITARLARGPVCDVEVDGEAIRCALGATITIGRAEATIVVASRAVSRQHLRVRREERGVVVEDLGTRNGTLLAGARLEGPIPVGEGVRLELGGEVPCAIAPVGDGPASGSGGVVVDVAGERFVAPLGPLAVLGSRLDLEVEGDASYVVLRTPRGEARPVLGELELGEVAELCVGDAMRAERGGPVRLRVLASRGADD